MSETPARRSRLEPEQRREQIVETATVLFGERTYAAVSMAAVADAAGVTRGLVHHYFATKAELYREVIESLLAAAPSVIRTDLGLSLEEIVAANVDSALDFVERNRETMSAITQPGAFEHVAELADVIDRAREQLVERMMQNHLGTLEAPPEVRIVLRGYLGLFEAATREWLVTGRATRAQVHVLLTRTILALMSEALPAMLALGAAGQTLG